MLVCVAIYCCFVCIFKQGRFVAVQGWFCRRVKSSVRVWTDLEGRTLFQRENALRITTHCYDTGRHQG